MQLLYKILDAIANIVRSIPFLILLILLIPFTRAVVGKSYMDPQQLQCPSGCHSFYSTNGGIFIKEVDAGVIEAARAMVQVL